MGLKYLEYVSRIRKKELESNNNQIVIEQ
jgi:hypothetical protein